jgi:hypothetical protein
LGSEFSYKILALNGCYRRQHNDRGEFNIGVLCPNKRLACEYYALY